MKNLFYFLSLLLLIGGYQDLLSNINLDSNHKNNIKSNSDLVYKCDSFYYYDFNSATDSLLNFKTVNDYDIAGNEKLTVSYGFNQNTGIFFNESKTEYSYDPNGLEMGFTISLWDTLSNKWNPYKKEQYSYNITGQIVQTLYYLDNTGNLSFPFSKNEYTYDNNGFKTLQLSSSFDTTLQQWNNSGKTEYTNDEKGNNILLVYSKWEKTTSNYIFSYKYELTYDLNSYLSVFTISRWDNANIQWIGSEKQEYSYDSKGQRILSLDYLWDKSANQWVNHDKYERSYDSNGNCTNYISYYWDENSSTWLNLTKYDYAYNFNNLETLEAMYSWDKNSKQYNISRKQYFYYSLHTSTSLNIININKILIYPNPTKDVLNIKLNSLPVNNCLLINLSGQVIREFNINEYNCYLNISNLKTGVYYIQIPFKTGNEIRKFIKD